MWKWSDRAPRQNVKIHPLDAYETELRGDVEDQDEDHPEWALVGILAGVIVWTIVGLILLAA